MMNPVHPVGDEDLFFQISFLNPFSPLSIQTIPEDQILHDPEVFNDHESCLPNYKSEVIPTGKGKQQQVEFPAKIAKDANKKWMHRETERQRRQDMATLFASLRSALPLEYIKGKRSASDHMDGAVKYVKHLKNKVKQLKAKKDELMRKGSGISVIVHPYMGGAEILCSYSFRKYMFTQSTLLRILIEEGLNVVSCTATKVDERFNHTIRLEDSDMAESNTNYSELKRKLTAAILSTEHKTASKPEN